MSATQELQLLEARTELEPQQTIKNVRYVKCDIGPKQALQMAWKNLDDRFQSGHSPSQQLMATLMKGPTISLADTTALFNLSMHCQSAIAIRNADPSTLRALDDQSILDSLVNRLDSQLRVQWLQHRRNTKTPSFELFTEWVMTWAEISRMDKESRLHHATPSYAEATSTTKTDTTRPSARNGQQSRIQNPQKPTPKGDREYRDTLRQRANTPPPLSGGVGTTNPPSRSNSPRTTSPKRDRANALLNTTQQRRNSFDTTLPLYPSGKDMDMKCAWCYHINKPHNHATPDCASFKNAEVSDRWHVIYRNRICQSCLLPGHWRRDCETPKSPCTMCNFPHHPLLGCRPEEQISLHLSNE